MIDRASRRYGLIGTIGLLALCGLFIALRWLKLPSLWDDPARWLFEVYRASRGEIVYRDFMWQFPPLSLWLIGGAFRLFGSTFVVTQIVLDALGVINVLLLWALARRLLSRWLALATTAAIVCALGAGGGNNFYYFSLQIYVPAQLTGLLGILLVLIVIVDYGRSGVMTLARWVTLAIGSTIGLLSKPEYIVGSVAGLIALTLVDRSQWFHDRSIGAWLRHYSLILLMSFGPAAIGYGLLGSLVGFDNLISAIAGYGQTRFMCPWWPTGISVFGVIVALGQGALWIAVLSAVRFNELRSRYGRRYWLLWTLGLIGAALSIFYLPVPLRQTGYNFTPADIWRYVISPGTVLLPVMWFALGYWLYLIGQWLRARVKREHLSAVANLRLVIASMLGVMSLRTLFGDIASITTLVPLAPMPIWLIVWPYMLIELLARFKTSDQVAPWPKLVFAVIVIYGAARLIDGLSVEARTTYVPLQTKAGPVYLSDHGASAAAYHYVIDHTVADEKVLDVSYGGGVNFAAQRTSPIFSTQFIFLAPDDQYLQLDAELIQRDPPNLIVGSDRTDFYSYGVIAATRCTFPRLVWRPDELGYDPAKHFPMIDYMLANYQPAVQFGGIVVFERKQ